MAEKAVKCQPIEAKYRFFLAKYLTRAGNADAAAQQLLKATELVPEMALAAVGDYDLNHAQPILDLLNALNNSANSKLKRGIRVLKQWPCEDGTYDLIICNLVLEHIQNLTHIFSEAARTLRPNGKFFINELHPFKQYLGTKARYEQDEEIIEVEAFTHHISDFTNAATANGLKLDQLNEYWHEADQNKPPRLISFIFELA